MKDLLTNNDQDEIGLAKISIFTQRKNGRTNCDQRSLKICQRLLRLRCSYTFALVRQKKRPDGTLQPSKFLSPRDNFALLCEANFEPESYKILARSMHIISFFSNLTISLINPFQTKK